MFRSFLQGSILLVCLSYFFACQNVTTANSKAPLSDSSPQADKLVAINQLIQQYLDLDIFSGVVLLADHGKPFLLEAYGLADRESETPITTNTLFDIGSMNKTMTAIVVYQLVNEGKLSLEDLMVDYLDGFQDERTADIRIHHLLNHSSGFGDYHWEGYFEAGPEEKGIAAVTERARQMELLFAPGEGDEYSNTGFVLLGAIIEKVTGISYQQNVQERIVDPLGLKNTYVQNLDDYRSRQAIGYRKSIFGDLIATPSEAEVPNPDGGFLSTVEDVFTFYRSFYYDDLLLNPEARSLSPMLQHFADLDPGQLTGSAGGFEGWNTCFLEVKGQELSIMVFANMDEPVAENLAIGMLSILQGEEADAPALPAIQLVAQAYQEYGIDFVRTNFEDLTTNFHPTDPKDFILNMVGYGFLYEEEDPDAAIELFLLNTTLFPEVANCWDSLGEAYAMKGDREAAITAYNKALELAPGLESAVQALARLQ